MRKLVVLLSALTLSLVTLGPASAGVATYRYGPTCGGEYPLNSCNYAGNGGETVSGDSFTEASGYIIAPTPTPGHAADLGMWIGIYNPASGLLVQAGLAYNNDGQPFVHQGGGTFYEFVGGGWDMAPNFTPTTGGQGDSTAVPYVAGHRYFFHMWYHRSTNWGMTIEDVTANKVWSAYVPYNNTKTGGTAYEGYELLGTSERPQLQQNQTCWFTPLLQHSQTQISGVTGYINGTAYGLRSLYYQDYFAYMNSYDGNTLLEFSTQENSNNVAYSSWYAWGTNDYVSCSS